MKKLLIVLTFLALYPGVPVLAVKVDSLYQAELPVASQSEDLRAGAMKQGLVQVLTKVSGDDQIEKNADIKPSLQHPTNYVQEYTYIPSNMASAPYFIQIQYDEHSINRILKRSGVSSWSQNRPLIIVWAAVTNAMHETEVVSNDTQGDLLSALSRQGKRYGLPLIFPVMDAVDMEQVTAENVVSMDIPLLKEAGKRYSPAAMLVGHVEATADGLQSQWQLVMNDHQWDLTANERTAEELVASVLNQASQVLAKRNTDKVGRGESAPVWLTLEVSNVTEKNDLAEVVQYLKEISSVQQVQLSEVTGDIVNLSVLVNGSQVAFEKDAELGRRMILQPRSEREDKMIYEWVH